MKKLFILLCLTCLTTLSYASTRTPIIIDTDMGFDDWMTIAYLLNNQTVEVKAITVEGTGESHCKPGLENLAKILTFTHHPHIPFSCGRSTPLQFHHQFPKLIRNTSDQFDNIHLPKSPLKPSKLNAPALIAYTLEHSHTQVEIITIGPLTNLAQALQQHPNIIRKIKMINIGGGAVAHAGDLNIPGISHSKNKTAEWNIYIDPVAASIVIQSGAPITMIPINASNMDPITNQSYEDILHNQDTANAHLIATILTRQKAIQHSFYHIDYWDPTTALVATYPQMVKEQKTIRIKVNLKPGNRLGTTEISPNGTPINVVLQVYPKKFYAHFLQSVSQH